MPRALARGYLRKLAIQGLGISGRPEALRVLQEMGDNSSLKTDWRDNVDEAISLNKRVMQDGAEKVFGKITE